ncbi:DUF2917 domain-containing protein [Chitinibacter sp. GC72]|uniref:DUF2917 domain-containing protein n=1 Tax=Chitinibacter sp. GC72 TaxID=1526917 RepID=UPI0012F9F5E8|nr:DUF2917 domain-containing protein [Chitinibacter sp. GC72]
MERYLKLQLEHHELLLARLGRDAQLCCDSGQVWLASNRHPQDVVLRAGEQYLLGAGQILIEGQGELRFCADELDIRPYFQTLPHREQ